MLNRLIIKGLTIALLLVETSNVQAAGSSKVYVIAIGNNAAPSTTSGDPLGPLKYADDDAATFYEFARAFAQDVTLLTVLDKRSQGRFPTAAEVARPPTLKELEAAVGGYVAKIARAKKRGQLAQLILYFSGHGSQGVAGQGRLHLLDGGITQQWLYDHVLAKVPAKYIHLLVDACHAEVVIRPRDASKEVSAQIVDLDESQAQRWLERTTLSRFPNVGAVVATTAGGQAHEWDVYEQGIFTHQVLSGLRGAADVNRDKRIEYSELHAFLAAANRGIEDPRAKLQVLVHAPNVNHRAPIVDLSRLPQAAWLVGATSSLGHFYLEQQNGQRLIDAHIERGHELSVLVPPETTLFLRSAKGEAPFRVKAGGYIQVARLSFNTTDTRARGALASALKRGLFQTAYGPHYYLGFVDRVGDVSVTFRMTPEHEESARSKRPATIAFVAAGVLLASAAALGGLALDARSDWNSTSLQRDAADAKDRYNSHRIGFYVTLGTGVAAGILGAVLYPWGGAAGGTRAVSVAPLDDGVGLSWAGVW